MENMDSTVIATALPAIAADIDSTPIALKLAFTAYFLALAIFIPISAWAADRFGPTKVFQAAIVVFLLGSLGCAMASSLTEFVMARFLGGAGGAMMTPLARLMLYRIIPREGLMRATATMTTPAVVAPLIGPLLGGFLTTYFAWQWIFLINIPIGILGIYAIRRLIGDVRREAPKPFDFIGFLLLALAFSGLLAGLSIAGLPFFPKELAFGMVGAGLIAGTVYLRYARGREAPILNPGVLQDPVFRKTLGANGLFLVSVGAIPFLLPLMLQLGFGLSAFASGMITFIGAAGAISAKLISPWLFRCFGFRNPLICAALLASLGTCAHALLMPDTPLLWIFALLIAGGVLRATFFTGQNVLAISEMSSDQIGAALAIATVLRPIATVLGITVAGAVLGAGQGAAADALPRLDAFHRAFIVVGAIGLLSVLPLLRLASQAGRDVSGQKGPR